MTLDADGLMRATREARRRLDDGAYALPFLRAWREFRAVDATACAAAAGLDAADLARLEGAAAADPPARETLARALDVPPLALALVDPRAARDPTARRRIGARHVYESPAALAALGPLRAPLADGALTPWAAILRLLGWGDTLLAPGEAPPPSPGAPERGPRADGRGLARFALRGGLSLARDPLIRGGTTTLTATRIAVVDVVRAALVGASVEEIADRFSGPIHPAQAQLAQDYYERDAATRAETDARRSEDAAFWAARSEQGNPATLVYLPPGGGAEVVVRANDTPQTLRARLHGAQGAQASVGAEALAPADAAATGGDGAGRSDGRAREDGDPPGGDFPPR